MPTFNNTISRNPPSAHPFSCIFSGCQVALHIGLASPSPRRSRNPGALRLVLERDIPIFLGYPSCLATSHLSSFHTFLPSTDRAARNKQLLFCPQICFYSVIPPSTTTTTSTTRTPTLTNPLCSPALGSRRLAISPSPTATVDLAPFQVPPETLPRPTVSSPYHAAVSLATRIRLHQDVRAWQQVSISRHWSYLSQSSIVTYKQLGLPWSICHLIIERHPPPQQRLLPP